MDEIKKLLGLKIKELRIKKGLSQEQLAEIVNLDRRSISNIECGNTFPASALNLIANALDVEIKTLFEFDTVDKTKPEIIEKIELILPGLSLEKLKAVLKLIETL